MALPSQDHRGTPEAPGRVVTLIERSYWEQLTDHHDLAPEKVWGVAYRIKPDRVSEVKEYLDIREINGYTIHYAPFHAAPGTDTTPFPTQEPIKTLVYIGTPENDQFVGPQDPQQLAEHIYQSHGPSGPNRDYLLELEAALNSLSPESGDEHVTDLSNRLRAIMELRDGKQGIKTGTQRFSLPLPVSASSESERDLQLYLHQHHFRRATSVDEQEETGKTS